VENALGGLGLSYDISVQPLGKANSSSASLQQGNINVLKFDAIGGHSGYQVDPSFWINGTQQQVLYVFILARYSVADDGTVCNSSLEIQKAELHNRDPNRPHIPPALPATLWFKWLRFIGEYDEDKPSENSGHTIFLREKWDTDGKKIGTLAQYLNEWPWMAIVIIIVSGIGGLAALYGLFRFIILIRQWQIWKMEYYFEDAELNRMRGAREQHGEEERGLLIDVDDDSEPLNEEEEILLEAQARARADRDKPLPERPLPPLPQDDRPYGAESHGSRLP